MLHNLLRSFLAIIASSSFLTSCSANSQNVIDANDVIKSIRKSRSVAYEGKHITGTLDFTKVRKEAHVTDNSKTHIDCEIVFINCTFANDVVAHKENGQQTIGCDFSSDVTMKGCVFSGQCDLSYSRFAGTLDCSGSDFRATTNFTGAQMNGGSYWTKTVFEGDACFANAQFGTNISFVRADFRGRVNFQNTRFNCNCAFFDSRFGPSSDFSNTYVTGHVNFSNASFAGRVECIGAYVAGDVSIANCTFGDILLAEENTVLGKMRTTQMECRKTPTTERNTVMLSNANKSATLTSPF